MVQAHLQRKGVEPCNKSRVELLSQLDEYEPSLIANKALYFLQRSQERSNTNLNSMRTLLLCVCSVNIKPGRNLCVIISYKCTQHNPMALYSRHCHSKVHWFP